MEYAFPFDAHRRAGMPVERQSWGDARFVGEDLAGVLFVECQFERVQFERFEFGEATFVGCRFDDCSFEDCRLATVLFDNCSGTGIAVSGGLLAGVGVSQTEWDRLVVQQAGSQLSISESHIGRMDFNRDGTAQRALTMSGATFDHLHAENAVWTDATLVELDLERCRLDGSRFNRTSFIRARARGLDLRSVEFESCNLYQSDFSNSRLRSAVSSIFAEGVLDGTDFADANLTGALFANASAVGARFDRASLEGALFPQANLQGASFEDATAANSVWTEADLTDAVLARMSAFRGIFRNATLAGAEVTGASFVETELHGVERSLDGADTRDARGTLDWRAEVEREARAGSGKS